MNILKSFRFSLSKKRSRSQPKISAPAPAQILNRLQHRLQPKNLGSDQLRLRNTGYYRYFLHQFAFLICGKKNPLIFKSDSRFSRVYPLFEYFYIYYFFHFRLQFFAMFGALLIFYLFSNCFPLLYKLMMFLLFFRMWCTHWPMLPVGRVDSR